VHRTFTCPHGRETSCRIVFGLGYYEHAGGEPCDFCNGFTVSVQELLQTCVQCGVLSDAPMVRIAVMVSADVRGAVYDLFSRLSGTELASALDTYCCILYAIGFESLTLACELFETFGSVVVENLFVATGHDFSWVRYRVGQPNRCMQALEKPSLVMTLRSHILASLEDKNDG